jgi:hypothetical protein
MKFGYRFILRISKSNSVLGMIEQFLTELCPMDFENFRKFCSFRLFSLQRLHVLKWNLIYWFIMRISRSSTVQLSNFWQSYDPWTSKEIQFAVFINFLCKGCTYMYTEMKFDIQIYHPIMYVSQTSCLVIWWRSVFIGGIENPDALYNVYGERLPTFNKLTNFLTHSDRYEQDLNQSWLLVIDLLVWDQCLNHLVTEALYLCEVLQ